MWRLRDERGSALLVVILTTTALVGTGAAVVDIAALLHEKRVLQNGADAGAYAIAEQCGGGDCGDPWTSGEEYADANADDAASEVVDICGELVDGVAGCDDPPAIPDGAGYVQVTTETDDGAGGDEVPYSFARLLGFTGGTVQARATVAWGGPAALTSDLPLTISVCEFNNYTNGGQDLEEPPPYESGYPAEAVIFLHDTTGANPCTDSANNSDVPGGFGWLYTDGTCESYSESGESYAVDTGASPDQVDCPPEYLDALVGTVVHIPIYVGTNGETGSNTEYYMDPFASFYITGYSLGGQYKHASEVSGLYPCNNPDNGNGTSRCISGFFVNDPEPVEGEIGGPANGVVVVQLVK